MKKKTNDELVFLPLGGSDEVGMNLNAYGFGPEANREWLIVDVGVTFGDLSTPGVDVIVPDPTFLEGENIKGIVLTHAHEDHIGALGWLWPRIKAPIYATPFTAYLIRDKLRERGILDVLDADQDLLSAKASRLQAAANLYISQYQLLSAMGLLTADHLQLGIPTYDPEAYYDAVKNAPATTARGKRLDKILEKIGN